MLSGSGKLSYNLGTMSAIFKYIKLRHLDRKGIATVPPETYPTSHPNLRRRKKTKPVKKRTYVVEASDDDETESESDQEDDVEELQCRKKPKKKKPSVEIEQNKFNLFFR